MKVLFTYFTGTNNTKLVGEEILKKIKNKNDDINFESIDITKENKELKLNIEEFDLILIGTPVYAHTVPHRLIEFVKENFKETSTEQKVSLFCTCARETTISLYGIHKYLSKKGYNVVSAFSINSTNNFYFTGEFDYTERDKREENEKLKEVKINDFINALDNNEKYFDVNYKVKEHYMGKALYKVLKNTYFANYAKKNFSSSSECVSCGKCEKECPAENIQLIKELNQIKFKRNCYLCTKCIHICPKKAILYRGEKIRLMNE